MKNNNFGHKSQSNYGLEPVGHSFLIYKQQHLSFHLEKYLPLIFRRDMHKGRLWSSHYNLRNWLAVTGCDF